MRRVPLQQLIALFFAFAMIWGCARLDDELPERNPPPRPAMQFDQATVLDYHDDDRLVLRLRTTYLERWAGSERIFVRPVDVEIFDSTGVRAATLVADSGNLDDNFKMLRAYGNVRGRAKDGAAIRSDSLVYDKEADLIKTDAYVRVVTGNGDVLQGKGLVSDGRLNNWRIVSEVKGIFQDATHRAKEVIE